MSQYNKTILTNAGLALAKRANAGQAKFEITRAVTSADDWSNKTIQDLEEVTAIPNIMQQGTVMDTEEVESNNSVIGVSLCFANKDLNTGYQIKIIGLYVKEEGQENDFLYAVTTAVTPEYMPDFNDKVLYRFNMQMYLVIGKAQAVNVVINDGASVTHGQFDKYKGEVTANFEKIENAHKEDMSHVVKSASINGGDEILPDEAGKLELVVPDPDLSKYVSLEQLTETLKSKADITAIPDKTATEEGIKQAKELAQEANTKAQNALDNKADKTTVEENLATKANSSDLTVLDKKVIKSVGIYPNNLHFDSGSFNYWSGEVKASPDANGYALIDLTDDASVQAAANQLNAMLTGLNHLQGKQTKDSADANALSETGVYYCSSPAKNFPVIQWGTLVTSNGNGARALQLYFPDDNSAVWFRTFDTDWKGWVRLANIGDVNNATNSANAASNKVDTVLTNSYVRKQGMNQNGDLVEIKHTGIKQDNGGYAFDIWSDDWTASKLKDVLGQLPSKANSSDVSALQNKVNISSNLFRQIQNSNNWNDIFGVDNPNNVLTSLRIDSGGSGSLINDFAAGIGFGGGDTKGVLSVDYGNHLARITGGNGTGPVWSEDIAWKTDVNDLQNQIQQLKDNQFEVQTFTDATAAANWEAQRPGKRMAIIQS